MRKISAALLTILLLGIGSCKKGDACVQKVIGNWYGPIHLTGCVGSVNMAIRESKTSCEVVLPNFPDGTSCGNSVYEAHGTVSGDSLFIPLQPLGGDSISGQGAVSGDELTLEVNTVSGGHILISAARQR
jgi:hypothetical protein